MCSNKDDEVQLETFLNSFTLDDAAIDPQYEDDEDDDEADHLEERTECTDTEEEISDTEEDFGTSPTSDAFYVCKDGVTKWNKKLAPKHERVPENLLKHLPSPRTATKNLISEIDIWSYFFNEGMLKVIVDCTNQHISGTKSHFSRERDAEDTNIHEIKALLGLIYMAGVLKANRLNARELFSTQGCGIEIFRLTMSINRFLFLMRNVRFDNKETREQRKEIDKLAPIRQIFDNFVVNCQSAYSPFHCVTIDEKLEGFRGRCSFKQYIPSKPNKYGIKIFALVDAKCYFTTNLEVYVGKQPDGPYAVDNSASAVVQRLCEPINESGRNVTTDNWFTSIQLLEALKEKKLTLLGTIRKNRKGLPKEFTQPPKSRAVMSTLFGFRDNATLVSYKPKKNKNVLLISSGHHDDGIDENTQKPNMILDYNNTKGGVDTVDKLCASYNCARITRRWPMVVFYALLNIAGINSIVIHKFNNPTVTQPRRTFLRNLSMALIDGHLRQRAQLHCLPRQMSSRIREITGYEEPLQGAAATPSDENIPKRGRCAYCDRRKNRPTKYSCTTCQKFMCLEHCTIVCEECFNKDEIF
ncbi:piggyBac transposable element-derived protein 4-like [Onthophagus taurus]|uniref:piggyBac transposable element-derived protein 4-like n=1 Tax=Onthophagus taurus TaxID=166361 RepID=UPI000C205488|nr:piggyBac transposable element-derived protein 4-like [Onthophagus taurus]